MAVAAAAKASLAERFCPDALPAAECVECADAAAEPARRTTTPDPGPEATLLAEVNDSNAGTRQGLTPGKRVGWNDPAQWQQTFELMRDYRELKTDMPATAFYTHDFAPT